MFSGGAKDMKGIVSYASDLPSSGHSTFTVVGQISHIAKTGNRLRGHYGILRLQVTGLLGFDLFGRVSLYSLD